MFAEFVPPEFVTNTLAVPAVPAGVVAVIPALLAVNEVTAVPPIVTAVAPAKPLPVIVTDCPPAKGPEEGLIAVTVGLV